MEHFVPLFYKIFGSCYRVPMLGRVEENLLQFITSPADHAWTPLCSKKSLDWTYQGSLQLWAVKNLSQAFCLCPWRISTRKENRMWSHSNPTSNPCPTASLLHNSLNELSVSFLIYKMGRPILPALVVRIQWQHNIWQGIKTDFPSSLNGGIELCGFITSCSYSQPQMVPPWTAISTMWHGFKIVQVGKADLQNSLMCLGDECW